MKWIIFYVKERFQFLNFKFLFGFLIEDSLIAWIFFYFIGFFME